jgi:hypothetical protein
MRARTVQSLVNEAALHQWRMKCKQNVTNFRIFMVIGRVNWKDT